MKVHSSDGSVIKTTSFPTGFIANSSGVTYLLTNIPKSAAQNITTETVFTDLNKTNVLSNIVQTPPHIDKVIQSSDLMPTCYCKLILNAEKRSLPNSSQY